MALPTNIQQAADMVGIRESLHNVITNIDPTDTPFYSMIKKGRTKSRQPEWLNDSLTAASATNAVIEGDDVDGDQPTVAVRQRNYVQLSDKLVIVSDTANAVDAAGRSTELKYQVAKAGKELKRDIEATLLANNASVAPLTGTAGECGGLPSWIETNDDRDGTEGGYDTGTNLTVAHSGGSNRAFTETQLKSVIKLCWDNGADPNIIMVGSSNKQTLSGFSGIATQYQENTGRSRQAVILGAADAYRSDFGFHRVIPNRFQDASDAHVLDPKGLECLFLQPFGTVPLGRSGHSVKRLLKAEYTLCVKDEKMQGTVADLNN